jgi:phospholipase A2
MKKLQPLLAGLLVSSLFIQMPMQSLHAICKPLTLGSAATATSVGLYVLKQYLSSTSLPIGCTARQTKSETLCTQEQTFLSTREPMTRKALHNLLGITDTGKKMPRIAVSLSGGGCRAMTASLGWGKAASETGLLDTITDIAAVSGSTWAITSWIASGLDLPIFIKNQRSRLNKGLLVLDETLYAGLLETLGKKYAYGQKISAMDIYGPLLANLLLQDLGTQRITSLLSTTHQNVTSGKYPLPLYTAINANTDPYDWVECTPFEIGSPYMTTFAPTSCYGSSFTNGTAVAVAPEQTLGYMMGIFGSAFEVSVKDFIIRVLLPLIKKSETTTSSSSELSQLLEELTTENRLAPSELPNFCYKMADCPIAQDKTITLVDAGIDYNLAIRPLLNPNRNVDIIIMVDASSDVAGAPELKLAETYAQKHKLPFPTINYKDIDTKIISIFYDEHNPAVPVVIYMPLIKNADYSTTFDPKQCINSGYCGSFNFTYTPEQFDELSGLMGYNLKQSMEQIKNTIKMVMERMQQ